MKALTVVKGIDLIAKKAIEIYENQRRMVTIFIAGGSASGKSTGTKNLEAKLMEFGYRAMAISADDYYKGGRIIMALMKSHGIGFDDPGAVDSPWLRSDIISLSNGNPIMEKKYKFGPDPAMETGKALEPPQILIIEGLFVLREDLRDLADIKVFFDIGFHGWLLRRIFRDTQRTGQRPSEILHYCATVVEPKYREWVLSTKEYADIVIKNEYDPKSESKNAKRFEHQIKLKVEEEIDVENLYNRIMRIGADFKGAVEQKDTYYKPKDRDFCQTGESIRIREQAGFYSLTYKGPRIDSRSDGPEIIERPKYELLIKKETKDAFINIYGSEIKVILKTRMLFHLGSLDVAIDTEVRKSDYSNEEYLGKFIEIRSTRKGGEEIMRKLIAKLGLGSAKIEARSYVEM